LQNLVEKGDLSNPLIIFNRTNSRAEQLSEKLGKDKTKVASSIEDAVKNSDIIFTCVGDDKAMEDTVESMLKTDVKGKVCTERGSFSTIQRH
jgi:3-hydroxyisobutyrate dehydrogenase-like beta-hydroxyacid dehydrogenase